MVTSRVRVHWYLKGAKRKGSMEIHSSLHFEGSRPLRESLMKYSFIRFSYSINQSKLGLISLLFYFSTLFQCWWEKLFWLSAKIWRLCSTQSSHCRWFSRGKLWWWWWNLKVGTDVACSCCLFLSRTWSRIVLFDTFTVLFIQQCIRLANRQLCFQASSLTTHQRIMLCK